jgi:hypothetical protein
MGAAFAWCPILVPWLCPFGTALWLDPRSTVLDVRPVAWWPAGLPWAHSDVPISSPAPRFP